MSSSGRPLCPRCEKPLRTCLCAWVRPTTNDTAVLILQHPLEVKQAKGSARLLQLSLQRCETLIGERFDEAELKAALGSSHAARQAVLLYPADAGRPATMLSPSDCQADKTLLVVLDGTWRKSLKMLHLNPVLQALPRLSLAPEHPSRYLIRKAHRPDQLSTLEACSLALDQIERASGRYRGLFEGFDAFVTAQANAPEKGHVQPGDPTH